MLNERGPERERIKIRQVLPPIGRSTFLQKPYEVAIMPDVTVKVTEAQRDELAPSVSYR